MVVKKAHVHLCWISISSGQSSQLVRWPTRAFTHYSSVLAARRAALDTINWLLLVTDTLWKADMSNYSGSAPPDFGQRLAQSKQLVPKKHPITNDYTILTKTLGVGVNGKVLECIHKATGDKRALKVGICLCQLVDLLTRVFPQMID